MRRMVKPTAHVREDQAKAAHVQEDQAEAVYVQEIQAEAAQVQDDEHCLFMEFAARNVKDFKQEKPSDVDSENIEDKFLTMN